MEKKEHLIKISNKMKEYFPKWTENKYLKEKNWMYKFYCNLIYNKNFNLIIFLNNLKSKNKMKYIKRG